jgi:thiamine-phosphate pyrophosphorylase
MPRALSMPGARTDIPVLRRARACRIAGLYAITPDLADTEALATRVSAALAGGASAVQYRNKSAGAALRREQAWALARVHARQGGLFIVNDHPALAAEVGADGVHVGQDDGSIETARAIVGPDRIVGVSCYDDLARAEAAVDQGADYVAFGSFFPSTVKPAARSARLELLERARTLGVPVVAIGGITAQNAPDLVRAGADAVAVISAVFAADDVEGAARRFGRLVESGARA